MDFSLSEEQRLLKDSVERFVADAYPFEKRRELAGSETGFGAENWARFAELGWLGLPFAEADGGFAGGGVDTMILMEAFGTGLVVEPYLSSVVLAGGLVARAGSEAQRGEILAPLIAGDLLLAFAYSEPQSRFDAADVITTAKAKDGGFVIDGRKSVVVHGGTADRMVVSARTAGGARDAAGISLFVVDPSAEGVEVRAYATVDGQRAAEVTLSGVRVGPDALLGEKDQAMAAIEATLDHAIAAVAAEAVGLMGVLHEDTLEYLKTRKQFGRPIGSFQVLQHRSVDMFMELEQARSMAALAAMRADDPDPAARRRDISAAKAQIGTSGRFVGQQAIQLHGGIGMTDELRISHYFKRLTAINMQFGDVDYHLDRMNA